MGLHKMRSTQLHSILFLIFCFNWKLMEAKPIVDGQDDQDDELLNMLDYPEALNSVPDDGQIMNIPGMEKKDGTLYFNGEKVKSIQGPSGQLTVPNLDETEKYSEDPEIIEDVLGPAKITPVKKLSKIHNIQEILKKLNVKSIKNVKSVKAVKNIEEINDSVAREFIEKHGLRNIVNDDQELEKIADEIETEDIIEATIEKGISKEKSKLDTLEKVKEIHAEKKKGKIDEYEKLKEIIENNLNAEVSKITAVKSISPVKGIEEVKSIKPVTTIKEVKKMSPVKSMKEIKNIYDLTEEQADKLRALIDNKNERPFKALDMAW